MFVRLLARRRARLAAALSLAAAAVAFVAAILSTAPAAWARGLVARAFMTAPPPAVPGDTVVVYGPLQVTSASGSSTIDVERFTATTQPDRQYLLEVQRGDANGGAMPTSLDVALNGSPIASINDFAAGVRKLTRVVTLSAVDTVKVTVAGTAGATGSIRVLEVASPSIYVYGPQAFIRETGSPETETLHFGFDGNGGAPYRMCIVNGLDDGTKRASSATIILNGQTIVTQNELNQQVGSLSRDVNLVTGDNVLVVTLSSKPSSRVTLCMTATDITPPTLTIAAPAQNAVTRDATIAVSGTVVDQTATRVTVNGGETVRSGTSYSATAALSEGTNTILVHAVDAAGNATDSSRTVTRDSQAPVVTIDVPAADRTLTNADSIDVSGHVTDRTAVTVNVAGIPTPTDDGGRFARRVALDAGTNFITVSATDQAGNTGSAVRQVVQDKTPPVIALTSPDDGTLTKLLSAHVAGTATDDNAVTVTVNGAPVSVGAGGAFATDASLANEGANAVTIVATDVAGNAATVTRTVNRDTQAPVIAVVTPAAGARSNQMQIAVSGTVSDAHAVTVSVGGTPAPVGADGSFSATAPLASEGDNAIAIVATDAAGNVATASRTIDRDTQAPTLAIVTPAHDTLTKLASVVIGGTASDRSGVTVTVNGAPAILQNGAFAESRSLNEGSNSFVVVATDGAGNSATATRIVASDRTPPSLALLAPTPDTLTNAAVLSVRGRVYDATTLTLTVNGVAATVAADSSFAVDIPLSGEGALSYPIIATDAAGNTSQVVATAQRDVTPPVVAIVSPAPGIVTKNAQTTVSGTVSDAHAVRVSVNGLTMAVANGTFAGLVPLDVEGLNSLTATATDAAGNQADATATISRDTHSPVITVESPANGTTTPSSSIIVRGRVADASATELTVNGAPTALGADGSYSATVNLARGSNPIALHAVDAAGNAGDASVTVTRKTLEPGVPPDPATVAPALNRTVASTPSKVLEFLYTGADPIQKGVAAGTIDKVRAAVVRGRVLQLVAGSSAPEPLQAVDVAILGHPEFGTTKTREDGWYDMVVNGGGPLTATFAKSGYLPAERGVSVPWQSYTIADDVLLLRPDTVVTTVAMNASQPQVARASVQTDEDGPRQATVIIPAGTQATMTLPNGTTQALTSLSLRATEFTVGNSGAAAMPGVLPATSSYTYAVQLSADQAIAAGVAPQDVTFSKPVPLYVDNFLDVPVGTTVPVGGYDARLGRWIAQNNGVVVKVLDVSTGIAQIDANGDGASDTDAQLAALGIDAGERAQLAVTYAAGATLWRAPVLKLWPYDLNYGSTVAGISPLTQINPGPLGAVRAPGCATKFADPIACDIQVATQSVGVTGAPFTLDYTSARSQGGRERSLDITLTGATIPSDLKGVELEVHVAGQVFLKTFDATPNLVYHFVWDGNDAYGRPVQGYQKVQVRIGHLYPVTYRVPSSQLQAFGLPCDAAPDHPGYCNLPADIRTRPRSTAPRSSWLEAVLGGWDAQPMGFGGFTPSILHAYDPIGKVLQMGDGTRRVAERMGAVVKTVAGKGGSAYSGDGGPALKAQFNGPAGLSIGPDGSMFVADRGSSRVRKIAPDGTISTVAGTGTNDCCDSRSGILATQANLGFVRHVVAMPDGGVLVANQGDYQIRRVWPDGTITVIAGLRFGGSAADGIAATSASIVVNGMAMGPDGGIYIAGSNKIRRIAPNGIITTVAGTGASGVGVDEIPALRSTLNSPQAIAVGVDGTIYFFDFVGGTSGQDAIRKVTPDGIIHLVQGRGSKNLVAGDRALDGAVRQFLAALAVGPDAALYAADDFGVWKVTPEGKYYPITGDDALIGRGFQYPESPAIRTRMRQVNGMTFATTGELYASIADSARVQRVAPAMRGVALGGFAVTSEDGTVIYVFDEDGRHIVTAERTSGTPIIRFVYDASGTLSEIVDREGDITRIQRDASGRPQAILASTGVLTAIELDASGMLSAASTLNQQPIRFGFAADGTLNSVTSPDGRTTQYRYDAGALTGRAAPGSHVTASVVPLPTGSAMSLSDAVGVRTDINVSATDQIQQQTISLPDGRRATVTTDGSQNVTMQTADGSKSVYSFRPDPRFGVATPLVDATITLGVGSNQVTKTVHTNAYVSTDAQGAIVAETDSVTINGLVTLITRDNAARTITEVGPSGRIVLQRYDSLGRITSDSVGGLVPTVYSYDQSGRLASMTRGARVWSYSYDANGRSLARTSPSGETEHVGYDAAGRPALRLDALGDSTRFEYDAAGRVIALTTPQGGTHAFAYDSGGFLRRYDPPGAQSGTNGLVVSYDAANRQSKIASGTGDTVSIAYDSGGRPARLMSNDGTYEYAYDSAGRIARLTSPIGPTVEVGYLGTLPARVASRGAIGGEVLTTYNNFFLPSAVTVTGAGTVSYTYDSDQDLLTAGAIKVDRNPQNGVVVGSTIGQLRTTADYNLDGLPTTLSASFNSTLLYKSALRRDSLGRIVEKSETVLGDSTALYYAYDSVSRLIGVKRNGLDIATFEYDKNGNRTRVVRAGGAVTTTVDEQDRLLTYGGLGLGYSTKGEVSYKAVGPDTTRFQYSALGALAKIELPSHTEITYAIDSYGRRTGKYVNGALVKGWIYDGNAQIVAEVTPARNGDNNVIGSRFVYTRPDGAPDYMVRDGQTFRLVIDDLGSVRLVVNTVTGSVAQQIDYDESGNVTRNTNPGFQPFGYAGGLYDESTLLVHFGERDYDPAIGGWMTKDPSLFEGGDVNLYRYAGGDPINRVDLTGLENDLPTTTFVAGQVNTLLSRSLVMKIVSTTVAAAGGCATGALWADEGEAGSECLKNGALAGATEWFFPEVGRGISLKNACLLGAGISAAFDLVNDWYEDKPVNAITTGFDAAGGCAAGAFIGKAPGALGKSILFGPIYKTIAGAINDAAFKMVGGIFAGAAKM